MGLTLAIHLKCKFSDLILDLLNQKLLGLGPMILFTFQVILMYVITFQVILMYVNGLKTTVLEENPSGTYKNLHTEAWLNWQMGLLPCLLKAKLNPWRTHL